MDFLANTVESLAKQASEITLYDVKSAVNKAKALVLNLSEMETKVAEATNSDPWGASSSLMMELAQATHNYQQFDEILPAIYQNLVTKENHQWRQIYKSLILLEYLIKNGSERVIDSARSNISHVRSLRNFHYIEPPQQGSSSGGKDQGINVRTRAKEIYTLLGDVDKIRTERRIAKQNRDKYRGVGNDAASSLGGYGGFSGGSGGFSGGSPSFNSGGSRYGGFGSDSVDFNSSRDFGGSSTTTRADHGRHNSNDFDEYDAGEWDTRKSSTTATSSSFKQSTAAPPKKVEPKPEPAPSKKEVNLFSFDDDEPEPAPVVAPAPTKNDLGFGDDDFDDFQSAGAGSTTAVKSTPLAASKTPNVFDLLNSAPAAKPAANFNSFQAAKPAQTSNSWAPLASTPQPTANSWKPMTSNTLPVQTPAPTTADKGKATPAPASDFSDLFGDFAPTPKPASFNSGAKMTMADLAAKKREDALFASPAGNNAANSGGLSGWDSLI